MDTSEFDDIRPYNDAELRAALPRIEQWELIPQIMRFIYPLAPAEKSLEQLRKVQTVKELQTTFMYDAVSRVIETTSDGFTCTGFDYIKPDQPCLYISNHRDITVDAFLLQVELIRRGRETSYIVFGNNLIDSPLMRDLFLSNKLIQMERGGNPMAFYRSLQHLSRYLHHLIVDQRQSVWIAQKNGRSKDGIDATAPAIIKMLTLGSDDPQQQTLSDLHIIPLAVSYEWDPCDTLKTNELVQRSLGEYHKAEGEDSNSVVTGIIGPKGHVHLSIGKPLSPAELRPAEGEDLAEHVAAVLDRRIQRLYHLMPTNYLAFDLLNNSSRFRQHYDSNVKNQFLQRLNKLASDQHRKIFLEMYANPVLSAQKR